LKRKIEELIVHENTAWDFILGWLENSSNSYHLLEPNRERAKECLFSLQITNKSTMGSIILETGGILIDNGWLRILGSGNVDICGDILSWNGFSGTNIKNVIKDVLIIAYDVIGGFFAINAGAFEGEIKKVYYFAPDALEWEPMDIGYTEFIEWVLEGDISLFYESFRWKGWEKDTINLKGNEAFSFYPFLWTKQGENITKVNRKNIPIEEIWDFQQEALRQFG
jgi:hypothetical protein